MFQPGPDLARIYNAVYLLTLGLLESVDISDRLSRESAHTTLCHQPGGSLRQGMGGDPI